jgi:hypothetical protein
MQIIAGCEVLRDAGQRRHGFIKGFARKLPAVSADSLSAYARLNAHGYAFWVQVTFSHEGEYWGTLPKHYCGMDLKTCCVNKVDEWGIRHDGEGMGSIRNANGNIVKFETYVRLDTQPGWDDILGAHSG